MSMEARKDVPNVTLPLLVKKLYNEDFILIDVRRTITLRGELFAICVNRIGERQDHG